MGKIKKHHPNAIDTDLTNDLYFLILEVKQLLYLAKETIETVDHSKIAKVISREAYVDNLRHRVESTSYDAIFQLNKKDKNLITNYKSLISLASNLHKISDFLVQSARQVTYIQNPESFQKEDLTGFYLLIEAALDLIHTGFTRVDKKIAEMICQAEEQLDILYLEKFRTIQEILSTNKNIDDSLTLLFIIRYFERIGDKLLVIGESILNITVGDQVDIRQYHMLEEAVAYLSEGNEEVQYDFKPFLFSRSGCKVGQLLVKSHQNYDKIEKRFFYKQGDSRKIIEEIRGINMWQNISAQDVPTLVWKSIAKRDSTLVVNLLKGENFLNYLMNSQTKLSDLENAMSDIAQKLDFIWGNHIKKGGKKSQLIDQIVKRKDAITKVHEDFFEATEINAKKEVNFAKLLKQAQKIEHKIQLPFHVFCHGDFNLDNILYDADHNLVKFVDLHRSGYKDYAQEVSVFIVSCLRIKVNNPTVTKKINLVCKSLFDFSVAFSKKHHDPYFQARLALGLFRSFITSTRFLYNDDWYQKLRRKAWIVFKELKKNKKDLKSFEFNLHKILD